MQISLYPNFSEKQGILSIDLNWAKFNDIYIQRSM